MACVNINSPEYKSLVETMDNRERFVARAVISKFLSNNERLPDFIELKSAISDLYNSNKGGIDYKEFYTNARSLIKSLIPSLSDKDLEDRVKFIDRFELIRLRQGLPVLSTFMNNTIYLSNSLIQDRGDKAYTDIRHEAFHMIFNNFLSEEEQNAVANSFKEWKPEHSGIQDKEKLEEAMADTFENFRENPKQKVFKVVKDFFNKILQLFGLMHKGYTDIQNLFNDIENGRFTRNQVKDSLVTRDKTILSKYDEFSTDLDLFLQTKSFMLNNLNELMFPKDNKNLNELENRQLFLSQKYNSPLFQNNKDIFKLGLSKEDALLELQNRVKSLKNSRTVDPNLSKVINVLSKPYIFKDLFDYLQPYSVAEVNSQGELVLKSQIEEDKTLTVLNEEDGFVNPNNLEISSKELINPVTKISETVKDFLSSITYETSPGNYIGIDPGVGFISLLNLVGNLYGNTSVEDNLNTIKGNYQNTSKGNQTKAVFNKLQDIHNSVINQNTISLNIKNVDSGEIKDITTKLDNAGIKHELFKDNMNIIIPDSIKIFNKGSNSIDNKIVFSLNRFNEGKESFLLDKKDRESNKTYIERIARETNIPSFVISKLFQYNEDRNTLAEVTKVAGSLRKLSPKFVRVITNKVTNDEGQSANITSYAFINKVNEFKSSGSIASVIRNRLDILPLRKNVVASIEKYSNLKGKSTPVQLKSILQDILITKLGVLTSSDFTRIAVKDMPILLNNLERIVNFIPEIKSDTDSEDFTNSELYLRHTSNLGNSLLKYTYEKNNPTSFSVSTSNKSKWENVMSNTSFKNFKNLEEFSEQSKDKKVKLIPYFQNSINNYLRFNPIFQHDYSNSTFSVNKNMLKVGEDDFYSDHQETYFDNKNSSYQKKPISFNGESSRDWINRNFLAQFMLPILDSLSGNKKTVKGGYSYFQQKAQPESAPNVSIVKMGINNSKDINSHIASMIVQEAYMNNQLSTSDRANLNKNTKKSNLPGLEGSTYFLNVKGENIFFDGHGNLNSKYGTLENGKLTINENNSTIKSLTKDILSNLDSSLNRFTNLAISEKATLEGDSLSQMYTKLQDLYLDKYKLTSQEQNTLKGINIDGKADISNTSDEERAILNKTLSIYYLNSYINGYFMDQLSSGATQNYKNPLDQVKRQAGVNAMNDTGLIDNKHGMPNNYRNIVIAAVNNFYGKSNPLSKINLLTKFFQNKKAEVGDAQSWDIPEYKDMLKKSFGKSVDMGVITKDVHFEVNENGESEYRKTSSAELTNTLVKNNKTLRDLRFKMTFEPYLNTLSGDNKSNIQTKITDLYNRLVDNNGLENIDNYMEYENHINNAASTMIHKASFDSAIKGSKPSRLSEFNKNEIGTYDLDLKPESVLNLNSAFNGIQQAIRHRYIDSFISHFTQLTYLTGLNRTPTSIKNNKALTRTLSKFDKAGIYDTLFNYRMKYDPISKLLKVNNRSRKEFIDDLKKKLDLPGNERFIELLNTKGISLNNPLFSEKLMQSFFNSFSKNTVNPKHSGGSFVLQSEFGFESSNIINKNSLRTPQIVKDEEGNALYAECYLPAMYSQEINHGELIYYDNDEYNRMFGFRIPSSDLHSSVPLKVIGYYPSEQHDNVIVVPSAVTILHGSDFDVDKLFVVRHGVFNGLDDEDPDPKNPDATPAILTNKTEYKTKFQTDNKVIAQRGIKFGYTVDNAKYDKNHNITGFGDNIHKKITNLEDILLDEKRKTQNKIITQENGQSVLRQVIKNTNGKDKALAFQNYRKLSDEVNNLNNHLKVLKSIQKGYYSNDILDTILDNISYKGENAEDIFTGISFDPVKGYDEKSEYSQLARVYSDLNKEDKLADRPKLHKTLEEAKDNNKIFNSIKDELQNLGVDPNTEEGKEDHLALINEELKSNWINARDEYIRRQRGTANININKAEQHANVHKETYMAANLVGIIANYGKGLSYSFHGITDGSNEIKLDIPDNLAPKIDGITVNKLTLQNSDKIKNQELKSLALNAAIDHVKEQILNVLNIGNNTVKIFLSTISTELNMHQASMLMLQPVSKELNSSDATNIPTTLSNLATQIGERLEAIGETYNQEELDKVNITTSEMEKMITTNFSDISSKKDLLFQLKVLKTLGVFNKIGEEISDVSQGLSMIQDLPYNLESAYDKLKAISKFIDVPKFFNKLAYTEQSEYQEKGFTDDLKSNKTLFTNVNLALNENALGSLEAIKTQVDIASELFSENSLQMQLLVNNILKTISDNSDPNTMFTGPNDFKLSFDSTKNMDINEKYLKGKNTFNITKLVSRSILNFLTSGLNISYNNNQHLLSLGIQEQELQTIKKENNNIQLGATRSYLNQFLMKERDVAGNENNFLQSQINPEWRIKPLIKIKRENSDNKFLRNLGVDFNFRNKVNIMTFNSDLVNSAENLAEIEQAVNSLNNLNNIYIRKDAEGNWIDLPDNENPETPEMGEVIFNILKASLYTDQFKFSSSKATNVIPPKYFKSIFENLNILSKELLEYRNSGTSGNKYYKDYSDNENETKQYSVLSDIKENLFINTIFSLPGILPNLGDILPKGEDRWSVLKRESGILNNGNIYDIYFDANTLDDKQPTETSNSNPNINEDNLNNTNQEVEQDISTEQATNDLYEKFKKNPSFIVDQSFDKTNRYELYMKVGSTGLAENNDLKYYYKKIGNVDSSITNNSFSLNTLLNTYRISDYFNPKRFAIPVQNINLIQDKISLNNVYISSFLVNRDDSKGSKTRTKVANIINKIDEIALYDSRNLDRVGSKIFKIVSREISEDKQKISFELESLPLQDQIRYNVFDTPLDLKGTLNQTILSRQEKIDYINSIAGVKRISIGDELTSAQIDDRYNRAISEDETKEVEKVIKRKNC